MATWNIPRIIRLVTGLGLATYSVISKNYMPLFIAAILILQAVFNLSCCVMGNCTTEVDNSKQNIYKDQIKEYNPKK